MNSFAFFSCGVSGAGGPLLTTGAALLLGSLAAACACAGGDTSSGLGGDFDPGRGGAGRAGEERGWGGALSCVGLGECSLCGGLPSSSIAGNGRMSVSRTIT